MARHDEVDQAHRFRLVPVHPGVAKHLTSMSSMIDRRQAASAPPPSDVVADAEPPAAPGRGWRGLRARLARLELRGRFRIAGLLLALPLLAGMAWVAVHEHGVQRQRVGDQARDDATLLAARFEDQIDLTALLLGTAGQAVGVDIANVGAINALLQNMRSYLPKSVDNVAVWGIDGHNIAALDRRSTTRNINVADRKYFVDAISRRDLVFEGPTVSRSTGSSIIQFAQPIIDARNEVVGVITLSMRSGELLSVIDAHGAVVHESVVTIINAQGRIVARSLDSNLWTGQQVQGFDALRAAFATGSGFREEVGIDGQGRIAGYAVVGRWPWLVMVGQPIERVTGESWMWFVATTAIGLAMLLAIFYCADRLARRITQPVVRLAADVERLAAGHLSHRSAVTGTGEMRHLVGHLNRMAAVLEARESALAKGRQHMLAVTDNVPAQIYYIDAEQRYRFVNGYRGSIPTGTAEEMIGHTVLEVRGAAVHALLAPHIGRALAGEANTVEAARVHEGRVHHFQHTYVPDRAEDGTVRGIHCFAQDITERREAELARAESEKRLVTITDNLPAMIAYVDHERRFRFANRVYEKWFGRPLDEIIGQPFDQLMAPALAAQFDYYYLRGMQGEKCDYELESRGLDGTPLWLKCSFVPDIDDATGKARGVYGMVHNVTKAKLAEQRLTRLAQFDTLTGLANRNQFNDTLARILEDNDRSGRPLALMFLDIDHFKQVNDRHGHANGDLLLKEFATRLAGCVRPSDAVARLSGDEFVVLLDGLHSVEEPQFIARKIIAALEKPFVLDDHFARVTTSIGIAMREGGAETASLLMKRADEALYDAKRSGRNTFRMAG